jgi:hypothetical protein
MQELQANPELAIRVEILRKRVDATPLQAHRLGCVDEQTSPARSPITDPSVARALLVYREQVASATEALVLQLESLGVELVATPPLPQTLPRTQRAARPPRGQAA